MFAGLQFNAYNESEYNFTVPFNSSAGNMENTNASRHFAEEPLSGYSRTNSLTFILIAIVATLFIACTCTGLVLAVLIYNGDGRLIRRNQNGDVVRVMRPDLLTLYRDTVGEPGLHQCGDEANSLETPSSIYPGDLLPSFSDSFCKEKLFSDTITTPLSNNSIITMTMRNNHLIVETEERIPVSCSLLNSNELYTTIMENPHAFVSPEIDDYPSNELDDMDSYSDDHQHCSLVCGRGSGDDDIRRPFYEPTTSRQAYEEDQHIELFHKNILVFPSSYELDKGGTVPSCSYKYDKNRDDDDDDDNNNRNNNNDDNNNNDNNNNNNNHEQQSSSVYGLPTSTGLTQSDLTGSSSSTSRHVQNTYDYGNQSEYVLPEFPLRKHSSSSFKFAGAGTADQKSGGVLVAAYSSPYLHRIAREDSVLQLTDCSSSEFSEPSK